MTTAKPIAMRAVLFLLPGLVWLLFGCFNSLCPNPKTDLLKLSSDERQWLPYSAGQALLFRTETGASDTLTVVQYTDTIENYWQGDECPERPQEVVRVVIANKGRADTLVSIAGEYGNQVNIMSKKIYLTYLTDGSTPAVNSASANYRYTTSLLLNGQTFSDVLTVLCPSCGAIGVSELYFSKKTGLVGYRKNGAFWVRQ